MLTGLLIGYTTLFVGLLLFLVVGSLFFVPAPSETQLFEKLATALLFSIVLVSVLFFGLNGVVFAVGIFLASIWVLYAKRLNVLALLSCLSIAGVGLYFLNYQSMGNQIIGPATGELKDSIGSVALESLVEKMTALLLNVLPLFIMVVYVYCDPKYRKKHEL